MNKPVEYQYLRPRQMVARRDAMPVAYMGLGILEWHGLHNPLGLDGVKANGIACYLADKLGGIVMPPQYWGEFRGDIAEVCLDESFRPDFSVPENYFDHTEPISRFLEVGKELFAKDMQRSVEYGAYNLWEKLMTRTMFQIETLGFEAIVLIPGHYPLIHSTYNAKERYLSEGGKCKVLILTDFVYKDSVFSGDHAGAFETSVVMALYPELVDINELNTDLSKPNIGVIGLDPRTHASKELGQKILNKFVEVTKDFIEDTLKTD